MIKYIVRWYLSKQLKETKETLDLLNTELEKDNFRVGIIKNIFIYTKYLEHLQSVIDNL